VPLPARSAPPASRLGDKWHLDEVVISIRGKKHWLWRTVDRNGFVLDVLVQSRRNANAAKRLMRKLLKRQGRAPRVMITDKLRSYDAAKREIMPGVEHRSDKGLNNRAENSHQPVRRCERITKRFKSQRHLQRFASIHDPIANLFHIPRHYISSNRHRELRSEAMNLWQKSLGREPPWCERATTASRPLGLRCPANGCVSQTHVKTSVGVSPDTLETVPPEIPQTL
jgi:putative transposase